MPVNNVAAIIIEPVQGEGGFHVVPKKYMQYLRNICDENGILLILDEVQSGFGRTGEWAAFHHYGIMLSGFGTYGMDSEEITDGIEHR